MYVNHKNTANPQINPSIHTPLPVLRNNDDVRDIFTAFQNEAPPSAPELTLALQAPVSFNDLPKAREPFCLSTQNAQNAAIERRQRWAELETLPYSRTIALLLAQGDLRPVLELIARNGKLITECKAKYKAAIASRALEESATDSSKGLHHELVRLRTLAAMLTLSAWPIDAKLEALRQVQATLEKADTSLHRTSVFGDTYLHLACRSVTTDQDLARLLTLFLQMGADANQQDGTGSTPAHLLRRHLRPTPALIALIQKGANPNIKDGFGYTVMHQLAGHAHGGEVLTLCGLAKGNLTLQSARGETLLHMLLGKQDDAVTTAFLVRHGVSPHTRDLMGLNAFDYASMLGRHCAQLFLGASESSYDPRALVLPPL